MTDYRIFPSSCCAIDVCGGCGALVAPSAHDVHDAVCPGRKPEAVDGFEYTLTRLALRQIKSEAWEQGWLAAWNPLSMHGLHDGPNPYRPAPPAVDQDGGRG